MTTPPKKPIFSELELLTIQVVCCGLLASLTALLATAYPQPYGIICGIAASILTVLIIFLILRARSRYIKRLEAWEQRQEIAGHKEFISELHNALNESTDEKQREKILRRALEVQKEFIENTPAEIQENMNIDLEELLKEFGFSTTQTVQRR